MSADNGSRSPRVGHVGRLSLPSKVRWLISAHLIVFALSLEDEEIVEMMAEAWNLSARAQVIAEVILSLILLAAWGLLTLVWVRMTCEPRRDEGMDR